VKPWWLILGLAAVPFGTGCGSQSTDTADHGSGNETTTSSGTDSDGGAPDLDTFFDPAVVQEFALEIAPEDRQLMYDSLPELVYVPADFFWNDVTIRDVGVRFKGNSSKDPNQTHKRSYLIKFNEYVQGQRLNDLRRLSLDNGVQFGSLFSERLITDILRSRGVLASRSSYCRLIVNGEYQGVYVNVERIDKSFLKHHFANPDGPLYKVNEGGPGATLEYVGDDPAPYAETFENKGDEIWDGDVTPVIDLVRSLDEVPIGDAQTWLYEAWEANELIELLPIMLLAGAFDQYTGWNAHNYYLYRDPDTMRWTYLPWDLDVGFADNAFGQIPVLSGWNAAYPYPVAPRPLLHRIVNDPVLLADYRARAADILEAEFDPDELVPRLYALYDLIEDDLADDPFPPVRATNPTDTGYDDILASLAAFMEARHAAAAAELADPQDTPPDEPEDIPPPGPPSANDPSDLVVVSTSPSHVELAWTDNATGEAINIVQRCRGAGCSDFAPHIGLDPDIVTAIDDAVTQDETYRYRVYAILPVGGSPAPTGPSNEVEATAN